MGDGVLTPLGDKTGRARLMRRAEAYWRLSRRRFMPSRTVAVATALVYFFTMVPGGPTAWADIADYFGPGHPRNNDQRNRGGQYSPEQLKSYLDYKERLAKSITQREQMLDPRRSKVQSKLEVTIDRTVQETLNALEFLERQAQDARRKVFAILGERSLFNYVKYADGKIVRMMDGLAKQVENERVFDANGNVSIRNTYDMQYNTRRLLTDYQAKTTDALGNTSFIKWAGGEYTADSVFYATDYTHADKNVVGYIQTTTDHFGNVTEVKWTGGRYNDKLLTDYHQVTIDHRGNMSTKDWSGATYDANNQIKSFTEIETDIYGNTRQRAWSGGTYIKNSAWREDLDKDGLAQDNPKYLLVGYREVVTDENGVVTRRDWSGAEYDTHGQLKKYDETLTDGLLRESATRWRDGTYDRYGRLMAYQQESTDIAGLTTTVDWAAEYYSDDLRLKSYREKTTDPLGLTQTVERQNMEYSRAGDLVKYAQRHTDARGNFVMTDWTGTSFDRYGRNTDSNEWHTDALGVLTFREKTGTVYDTKSRQLAYTEYVTDEYVHKTEKTWSNARYDHYNRMLEYKETNKDALNNTTIKEWRATRYDWADRAEKYTQTNTDADGNVTQSEWTAGIEGREGEPGYNKFGQVLAYTETVTDKWLKEHRRIWVGGEYDDYGNLSSYSEWVVDPVGGAVRKNWVGGTYDQFNRLTHYGETFYALDNPLPVVGQDFDWGEARGASSREVQSHAWTAGEYDKHSRLKGFSDVTQLPTGETANVKEFEATYDNYHRKKTFRNETTGPEGVTYKLHRTETDYDNQSRVLGYLETARSDSEPNIISITRLTGRTYDRDGRATGGEEETTTGGVTHDNKQVNATVTRTVSDAKVTDRRLTSYTQTTVHSGTGPTGETLNLKEKTDVTDITYFDVDIRKAFSEVQTVHRTSPGLVDHTTKTTRTGMVHNLSGLVVAYDDKIEDSATPGGATEVKRSHTIYGTQGEALGYREKTKDLGGLTTDKVTTNIVYDAFRRVMTFGEKIVRTGDGRQSLPEEWANKGIEEKKSILKRIVDNMGGVVNWATFNVLDVETLVKGDQLKIGAKAWFKLDASAGVFNFWLSLEEETVRVRTDYDVLGRLSSTHDRRRLAQHVDQDIEWNATAFDYAGRAVADQTVTHVKPRLGENDYTLTSNRSNIKFNLNEQWLGFKDDSLDSRTPELFVNKTVKDMAYDDFGALAGQHEETNQVGTSKMALPDVLDSDYLESVGLWAGGKEWKWSDFSEGEKTALLNKEEITKQAGPQSPPITIQFKDNAVQVVVDMTVETVVTRSNAVKDGQGRLVGYTETVNSRGPALNRNETRIRSDIKYDSQGRVETYTDSVTSDDADLINTVTKRTASDFDPMGQLTGYKETTTQYEAGVELKKLDVARQGMLYDERGRLLQYDETQEGTGLKKARKIERRAMTYTPESRLTGYNETVREPDGLLIETVLDAIKYNPLGQETSRHDVTTTTGKDAAGQVVYLRTVDKTRHQQVYNPLGQLKAYVETETSDDTKARRTTVWTDGTYDEKARLFGFKEKVLTQDIGKVHLNSEYRTNRVNTWYNGRGLIESQTEETRRSDAPGLVTKTVLSATSYTALGQMEKYTQTATEEVPNINDKLPPIILKTRTTTRHSTQFNDDQLVAEFDETVDTINGQTGDTLNVREKTVSKKRTYSPGRVLKSYEDTRRSNATGTTATVATWRADKLDIHGRTMSSTESQTTESRHTTSQKIDQAYDDFGRLIRYQDQNTDSARPNVITDLTWAGSYDKQNRVIGFEETKKESGPDFLLNTYRVRQSGETVYDAFGRVTNYTESSTDGMGSLFSTVWRGTFNGLGQLSGFNETTTQNAPGLNIQRKTNRNNANYDVQGRLYSYEDTAWSDDTPELTTLTNRTDTQYDTLKGRVNAFTETTHKKDKDNKELHSVKKQRTTASYDDQDRFISYAETESEDTDRPKVTVNTVFSNAGYNGLGQMTGWDESKQEFGLNLDFTTKLVVSDRQYKDPMKLGRLTHEQKERTVYASAEGPNKGVTTTTTQDITGYNNFNRATQWTETATRKGERLNQISETKRTGTDIDNKGRVRGYTEITTSSEVAGVTSDSNSLFEYDGLGRLSKSTEETSRVAGSALNTKTTTVKSDIAYRGFSLQEAEKEIVTDQTLNLVTTYNRTGRTFNELGQATGYTEIVDRTTPNTATSNLNQNNINSGLTNVRTGQTFDAQGRLTSYIEEMTEGQRRETTNWSGLLNRDGQAIDVRVLLKKYDVARLQPYQEISTHKRSQYNDQGQTIRYTETTEDSAAPLGGRIGCLDRPIQQPGAISDHDGSEDPQCRHGDHNTGYPIPFGWIASGCSGKHPQQCDEPLNRDTRLDL
jgi:hypothetical protein